MSGESKPRFRPTEHLASEAIAAYVDGELRMNAYLRAAQHLAQCPECAAEVDAQQQARVALRQSGPIQIPNRLHDSLSRIPLGELPGAGATSERPAHPAPENSRTEAVFGFLPDSFTATRWAQWWRK
ncbi:zf-HC2 domain-containing protein [Nocardia sp. XZ_19_385]|uniref:zf-HC2 domain-containing protein n=1 Tax=Nocardia sp. XZ_19_385 TaxID=2769488 RepID=UPI00188ECAE2|nr:zf-HC2 domain-containing protein [Nocardia sp. XZ_19_385]